MDGVGDSVAEPGGEEPPGFFGWEWLVAVDGDLDFIATSSIVGEPGVSDYSMWRVGIEAVHNARRHGWVPACLVVSVVGEAADAHAVVADDEVVGVTLVGLVDVQVSSAAGS
jgi:hypothetical protein